MFFWNQISPSEKKCDRRKEQNLSLKGKEIEYIGQKRKMEITSPYQSQVMFIACTCQRRQIHFTVSSLQISPAT